jgi:ABC-type branched-subunit amino acid transport system substrate-binding protein
MARLFRSTAAAHGITVRLEYPYRPGTTDFADLLERTPRILPDSVDAVFCGGGMRELVALFSQLANEGFLGPFIGTHAMGEEVVAGIAKEFGLLALYPGEAYVSFEGQPGTTGFEEAYVRLYGEEPDDFAHRGWTAFGLVGDAVERGGYCVEALERILEASAAPARERGQGRNLRVPQRVGVPEIFMREGIYIRQVGRTLPAPEADVGSPAEAPADSAASPATGADSTGAPPRLIQPIPGR